QLTWMRSSPGPSSRRRAFRSRSSSCRSPAAPVRMRASGALREERSLGADAFFGERPVAEDARVLTGVADLDRDVPVLLGGRPRVVLEVRCVEPAARDLVRLLAIAQ